MVRLWKFSSCLTHMSAYMVTAQCSTTARKLVFPVLKTPRVGCYSSGLQRWGMLLDYLSNNSWPRVSSMLWSLPTSYESTDLQFEHHIYAFERLTISIPTRKKTQEFKLVRSEFSSWNSRTQMALRSSFIWIMHQLIWSSISLKENSGTGVWTSMAIQA